MWFTNHVRGSFLSLSALTISFLSVATFANAASSTDLGWVQFDRSQFDGNVALDTKGEVQLFWKLGSDYSTYGVASRSNGFLALGFSQTGAMTGADIALGYKDHDGKFVLENRHATGFIYPELSEDQTVNMRLKEGHQGNGSTSYIFEKKNTAGCAETQATVETDAWQWFIYSFSEDNTFAQHLPGHNGKQYVKLGTGKTVATNTVTKIAGTSNFTITQDEITIPTDETTYCYSLHKMPAGKKNFLLGEIPTRSSSLLHHLVVYSCYGITDDQKKMLGKAPNCDYENFSNFCNGFVTEWAPGMSGRTFEEGYGKPFGSDYYEYVMLETHYNNPDGLSGEKDAATYTFQWNDKPVKTEIGTLTLGDLQVEGWYLDPGKELVAHSTVCTPECTDRWPSEGITAFSVFHHMHFRGRNAKVQIIRDNKEIAALSTLQDFEYGYQFSKNLALTKLMPGDRFITTCEFNTMNDTKPVPGGRPSKDEMCFAWVDYYPANNVLACTQVNAGASGELGMCLQSSGKDPSTYGSKYLNATYTHLEAAKDTCAANATSTTTGAATSATGASKATTTGKTSAAPAATSFSQAFLLVNLSLVAAVFVFNLV